TYANAWASAEWKVRVSGQLLHFLVGPSFRSKIFRIVEASRIAMDNPGEEINLSSLRHPVACNLAVLYGLPPECPGGRIKPQRFFHNSLGVSQLGQVFNSRRPAAQHSLKLVQ